MIKNLSKKRKKKGFTLIELVIVLAVMAIIALIAIPNFTAIRNNSKEKADARSKEVIERTIHMLVADETIDSDGIYTVTFADKDSECKVTGGAAGKDDATDVETALKEIKKPQTGAGYTITVTDGDVTVEQT